MWCTEDAESEGMYAVSQCISEFLRDLHSIHGSAQTWTNIMKFEIS
jgi:hypothetical protein